MSRKRDDLTTVEAAAKPTLPAHARTVIATLLVAAFVVILNETIMAVALPRLMVDLGISASTVQWLTSAFLLTMAVVIPTTGFLLERIATRTVFILAMSLFCLGTLVAGLAPGFWLLLIARIIQASGTAIMVPLLMTSILTLAPMSGEGCDGEREHRHLGCTCDRADPVRADLAVPAVALSLSPGVAGGARLLDHRCSEPGQRRRAGQPTFGHRVGAPVHSRVRGHRVRPQQSRHQFGSRNGRRC